jgi:predicted acylesterase/phospholipase RssA
MDQHSNYFISGKRLAMRIFILPVSGGAFPVQLGLMSELHDAAGIAPDIVLGSSGGNVAAYIALAANWTSTKIAELVKMINSSMFAQSWWPYYLRFMPSSLIGVFKGSLYSSGSGTTELFQKIFTPQTIGATEIWTGTLNRMTGKGEIFCNRHREESLIRPRDQDTYASLFSRDCMPLNYMNRNCELISQVTMASASIPLLVPERVINGQEYVDGGTLFASPLTALQDEILEAVSRRTQELRQHDPKEREPIHLDYLSSFDLQAHSSCRPRTIYDNGTSTVGELIKSLCIQDRLAAIELLRTPGYAIDYVELDGSVDNLRMIEKVRHSSLKSLLELCPTESLSVNLLGFTGTDILNIIKTTRSHYRLRFWYIRPDHEKPLLEIARKLPIPRHHVTQH